MTDKNTGGPAYPVCFEGGRNNGEGPFFHEGMTLRDYIATHALSGMLPNDHGGFKDWGWYAEAAYSLADAMLAARSKT